KPPVVILAAGASERLGTCKALVQLGGVSALERLLREARRGGAEDILIVVGAHRPEIEESFARSDARHRAPLLHNPDWPRGRTGSLALAAAHFGDRALLVAPIDVPMVSGEVFASLFEAWEDAGDPPRGWLAPCVDPGPRFGHPIVLGRALATQLRALDSETPLARLRAEAAPLLSVRVADVAILDDLDTPDDLKRIQGRCLTEG
ncbi:MAG TPA: NTP transferase domain-containing protein, partial [Planctomycetota bacterium]|nr:NTP transferase domain-containing protein [Planctomycetota bacterium]